MNIEKYRSVADLQDLTSEQVGKIATAQAVEAAIFEYNYQFNLATQTQMSYHELIYTIIVTGVSTTISMGATLCVGKVVQLTGSLANTAAKELSKSASKTLLALLQPTAGFTVSSVAWAVVREIGQEVLIDPWIESTVSGWVRRAGGDAMMQMVLSSVAESLRETLTGPFANLFSSQQSGGASLYEQLDAKYFSNGLKPTIQDLLNSFKEYKAEINAQIEQQKEQMTALGRGFKALTFVLGAVGFGATQFMGPSASFLYATLATFCFSEGISLKSMFRKTFNPVMGAASKVDDVVRNNKWIIINTLEIGVIGAMIGVPIAGMLTPFLGPIVGGIAGSLITIAVMPFMMTGMVKITDFAVKDNYKEMIERMRFEIAKIVPKSELWRGKLANWKVAKYLGLPYGTRSDGRMWETLSDIIRGNRHITQEDAEIFEKSLYEFFGEKATNCIKYINDFLTENRLRKYSNQQWHLYKPDFNVDFFTGIANEKFDESSVVPSYWYGFMCSDASSQSGLFQQSEGSVRDHKYRYDISIELQKRDKGLLEQFCDAIGIDPINKIKEREREKWNKIYTHVRVSFGCRDMIDDLNKLEFTSSKELRKEIPNYVKESLELAFKILNRENIGPTHIASTIYGKIALVWLRGAYDGDGFSGSTQLCSASKQYLESIKRAFRIKYPVRPSKHDSNLWVLSLGARLFNAMTSVCIEYDLGLERKNLQFSENRESLDILKESLETLSVDKAQLQDLVYKFRQFELVRMFKTTKETFRKLLNEWKINLPLNGYWINKGYADKDKFLGEFK